MGPQPTSADRLYTIDCVSIGVSRCGDQWVAFEADFMARNVSMYMSPRATRFAALRDAVDLAAGVLWRALPAPDPDETEADGIRAVRPFRV